MTIEEIQQIIAKLSYQVSILGQTIDYQKHPVEALIFEMNWSDVELQKAHDIFERWDAQLEKGHPVQHGAFESDFKRELDVGYQRLKSIVLAFYRNHQWTNVCESFVDSFGMSPSLEYHSIMRRERD